MSKIKSISQIRYLNNNTNLQHENSTVNSDVWTHFSSVHHSQLNHHTKVVTSSSYESPDYLKNSVKMSPSIRQDCISEVLGSTYVWYNLCRIMWVVHGKILWIITLRISLLRFGYLVWRRLSCGWLNLWGFCC